MSAALGRGPRGSEQRNRANGAERPRIANGELRGRRLAGRRNAVRDRAGRQSDPVCADGASMMAYPPIFAGIRKRPGMYVTPETYDVVAAYVQGYDAALDHR